VTVFFKQKDGHAVKNRGHFICLKTRLFRSTEPAGSLRQVCTVFPERESRESGLAAGRYNYQLAYVAPRECPDLMPCRETRSAYDIFALVNSGRAISYYTKMSMAPIPGRPYG
jgi:hypothetical protein